MATLVNFLEELPLGWALIAAFGASLAGMMVLGKLFMKHYAQMVSSQVREWTPERHQQKNNTPTMGGLCIIGAVSLTLLALAPYTSCLLPLFLFLLLGFGLIGFLDDFNKLAYKRGVSAWVKASLQGLMACAVGAILLQYGYVTATVCLPFCALCLVPLGIVALGWLMFVIIGASNGVNLTDGLDGLAVGSLIPNFLLFAMVHFMQAGANYGAWHAFCALASAALAGACVGFLYYNRHPARMFMGDVGSLPLGAALAFLALTTGWECILCVTGLVFVVETLSVIIQIVSYKVRGKRVFKMAPLHHHFELNGFSETTIVASASLYSWIVCLLMLLIGWYVLAA
jgi:phospho-N-acetylmuramoyl-pentapeptide-transferase